VIPLARRAPEGGLRLRARIELDGEEYRGQRTSRAQAGLDSRPPRRPQPADDDMDDDDDEDEDEDDDAEDSLDMDGEFDDSDEEADVDDDEDEEAPRGKKSRGVAMRVDGEAAALEAELAAVAAAEAAAAASLRARAGAERATARAVAHQATLWERSLALRIGLQRALTGAARLPTGAARAAARAAHPPAAAALDALAASAAAAAEELAGLIAALCARHPEIGPEAADVFNVDRKASKKAAAGGSIDVDALWARLDGGCRAFVPFRDAAFDKWHAKASLAGAAPAQKGGGLRALNQPPSAQVRPSREVAICAIFCLHAREYPRRRSFHAAFRGQCACHSDATCNARAALLRAALRCRGAPPPLGAAPQHNRMDPDASCSVQVAAVLRDSARARLRAAPLASAAPPRLCEPPAAPPAAPSVGGGSDGAASATPRDAESYDDAEFYAQLLKELLEASGPGGGGGAAARAPKQRKAVDRRASKGRRLRYAVVDKLVNFMAPTPLALPPNAEQLLRRLFGAAPRTIATAAA
jgi:protein AATF/BFR2